MPENKLKFLVDVGVGKKVEEWLKENRYDVKTVRSIDPKAKDTEILKIAISESRMVITMDKDFGELVFKSGKSHAGVLILRIEDANGNEKVELIKKILHEYEDKMQNRFCVFKDGRLRISR
jgi:predicted nuclease of predicted toxin-antitoxin system